MTDKDDGGKGEASSYLNETFVTDDGIEVPPPSRPMGPRRLARYRDDAAAYLRALRDGDTLPAEAVPYLVLPEEDSGQPRDDTRAIQQRFNTLAQQGGIDTDTQTSDDLFSGGGKDTRDDVAVPDVAEPSAPPGIGPDTQPATVEQIIAGSSGASDLTPQEQVISASDIGVGGDLVFDEDELDDFADPELAVETEADNIDDAESIDDSSRSVAVGDYSGPDLDDDTEHGLIDTDLGPDEGFISSEFIDGEEGDWTEADADEVLDTLDLPDPVRALDARGLDLDRIETSIDDDPDEDFETAASGGVIEGQRDVLQPTADALGVDEEKTPRGKIWFLIFLLLVILAVVAAWFFFQ